MNTHPSGFVRTVAATVMMLVTAASVAPAAQTPSHHPDRTGAAVIRAVTGTVLGSAWKGDATAYPQARIRLRNVDSGRGVARTLADGEGRFRFEAVNPGVYVAELLASDDKVLAVSDVFSVMAGAQAVTVVRLSAKAPWFGGFFGNAAAAAIAAASTLGVTANGSSGRPASAQ
jgi:hypothetical protein